MLVGTHEWEKFVSPEDLSLALEKVFRKMRSVWLCDVESCYGDGGEWYLW